MKQVMIGFMAKQVTVPQNMVQKVYRLQDILTQFESIGKFMETNNLAFEPTVDEGVVAREKREQVLTLGKELDRLLKRIPTEVTEMLAKEVA